MSYTLELYFNDATNISIPSFPTKSSAAIVGMFIQEVRRDLTLYEVREMVVPLEDSVTERLR